MPKENFDKGASVKNFRFLRPLQSAVHRVSLPSVTVDLHNLLGEAHCSITTAHRTGTDFD